MIQRSAKTGLALFAAHVGAVLLCGCADERQSPAITQLPAAPPFVRHADVPGDSVSGTDANSAISGWRTEVVANRAAAASAARPAANEPVHFLPDRRYARLPWTAASRTLDQLPDIVRVVYDRKPAMRSPQGGGSRPNRFPREKIDIAAKSPVPAYVARNSAKSEPQVLARAQIEPLPPPATDAQPPRTLAERLKIPTELPGANVPAITLPPKDEPEARAAAIDKLFPELPAMRALVLPRSTPDRPPLTLIDLQNMAIENSPVLAQAAAEVSMYLGDAIQQGLHPNPVVGYESDTVGSSFTRNYHGLYVQQVIKTAGKLNLARMVANMEVMNAHLNLRRTHIDLVSRVKAGYFAVLVAQENLVINEALVRFMYEAFRVQVDQLQGEAAAYEPAQLRALETQARAAVIQARNRYVSAWKQLAATIGIADLPVQPLAGSVDLAVPRISYEAALTRILSVHPDILAARNTLAQARLQLRLDQVKAIPDVNLYGTFQEDFTTPTLPGTSYNLQAGVPLPVFDRNQGGIVRARGQLARATQELRRASNDLASRLADAFERYETNRIQLIYYRDQILPDLVRAYRGIYERHQQEPETVGFGDIIVAQQNFANALETYLTILAAQWTAVADLANLLQAETIEEMGNVPARRLEPLPPPAPRPGGRP